MRESLINLLELQKVDNELQALDALKGDLPQQVRSLQMDLEARKRSYEDCKNELQEVTKNRLSLESELKTYQEQLKKYQEQLYAVTSNREYDAITVEIDSMNEKIDQTETQILELIEQEEQLKERVGSLETQIAAYEEELTSKQADLNEKIKATENEYQVWQSKRRDIVNHLTKPILSQYERIRRVRGETTVVSVNKYACGGCFSAIPPQKVVEIKHMNQLIMCESCGRILVYANDDVAVAN